MTDGLADRYDARYSKVTGGAVTVQGRAWPRNRLQALCFPPGRGNVLVEIGCGEGDVLLAMASRYRKLVGTEMSAIRLDRARARLAAFDFTGILAQNESLAPIADESVDRVLSADVIEHVVDPYRHIAEIHRILKPGGDFIVNTPNVAFVLRRFQLALGVFPSTSAGSEGLGDPLLFDGGHLHYFTMASLAGLLERHGFDIVKRIGFGRFGFLHNLRPALLAAGVQVQGRKAHRASARHAGEAISKSHADAL
jgi:SAM-dependent methyltransferase